MGKTQITLRNIQPSPTLSREIEEKCAALERCHPHIVSCHVTLACEAAHGRPAGTFSAMVHVAVPGDEFVVNHAHHMDAYLALRDAFAAAKRCLKDAATRASGSRRSVTGS